MFGRRKDDEDPFAALKGGGETFQSTPTTAADIGLGGENIAQPRSPAVTTTAPTAVRTATAAPTASSTYSRRYSSGGGVIVRLAVIGVIVVIAVALPLLSSTSHSVHSISIPSFSPGTGATNGITPSAPSTTSYLRSSSLRGALRRIASIAPHSSLSLLRLDSHSLSTTAVLGPGRAKLIYFGPSGTYVTSSAAPSNAPVPISAIKPSAINRIVAGMSRQFRVRTNQVDYMVLTSLPSRGASWIIFAKTHGHPGYSATLSGTRLARL